MRSLTDSAQNILKQVLSRAHDRGLALHLPDEASIVMLVLCQQQGISHRKVREAVVGVLHS